MVERSHLQELIKIMNEPRKFIQVIMGPRQVGKTTLVTQLTDKLKTDYLFISADAVATNTTLVGAAMGSSPNKNGPG